MTPTQQTAQTLIPFTQVPFSGPTMPLAVGRVVLYGAIAYSFRKNKILLYAAGGAALASVLSSISPVFVQPQVQAPAQPQPLPEQPQ